MSACDKPKPRDWEPYLGEEPGMPEAPQRRGEHRLYPPTVSIGLIQRAPAKIKPHLAVFLCWLGVHDWKRGLAQIEWSPSKGWALEAECRRCGVRE